MSLTDRINFKRAFQALQSIAIISKVTETLRRRRNSSPTPKLSTDAETLHRRRNSQPRAVFIFDLRRKRKCESDVLPRNERNWKTVNCKDEMSCARRTVPTFGAERPRNDAPFEVQTFFTFRRIHVMFKQCLRLSSGCSIVVEHTVRDREVVGSNSSSCWAFLPSLSY